MTIAVIGMHGPTQGGDDYEHRFRLAHDPNVFTATEAFEAHALENIAQHAPAHLERLADIAEVMPLHTMWPSPYKHTPPRNPIESSIAYMLDVAISRKPEAIGLYGVSMAGDEEYAYQRPNVAYLVGLARGRGIKVTIHPDSKLFASQWPEGIYGHPKYRGSKW